MQVESDCLEEWITQNPASREQGISKASSVEAIGEETAFDFMPPGLNYFPTCNRQHSFPLCCMVRVSISMISMEYFFDSLQIPHFSMRLCDRPFVEHHVAPSSYSGGSSPIEGIFCCLSTLVSQKSPTFVILIHRSHRSYAHFTEPERSIRMSKLGGHMCSANASATHRVMADLIEHQYLERLIHGCFHRTMMDF